MKVEELREGPPFHSFLPPPLLGRIALVYRLVGYLFSDTFEEWADGFRYDLHPEQEVLVWGRIGLAWRTWQMEHAEMYRRVALTHHQLVGLLVGMSMGMGKADVLRSTTPDASTAISEVWSSLWNSYEDPIDLRVSPSSPPQGSRGPLS